MSGVALRIRSLAKSLGGRAALSGVSLDAADGERLALLGPSGSGKTTLLRLIAGLERPDAGEILFDGKDVRGVPPRERAIGMVFQDLALWPYITVAGHVDGDVALLERFGLATHAAKRPHELSGGERQRLALARALARRPRLLLLDEPFSSLDPLSRRRLADELPNGVTTLYVSHYLEAPVARADRVALLRDGRIVQVGTLSEIRANPADDWVAAFVAEEERVQL